MHETVEGAVLKGRLQALKGSLGANVMHGLCMCCMLGVDTDLHTAARNMQQMTTFFSFNTDTDYARRNSALQLSTA